MSQPLRKSSQVAKRYADSLLDLAQEKPGLETIDHDVRGLLDIIRQSKDLDRALGDPRIKTAEKKAVMRAITDKAKYNDILTGFIATIADNDRLDGLRPILEAVIDEIKKRRGEIDAEVIVANDLDDNHQASLKKAMVKSFGSKVNLTVKKDETLLGGVVLKVGSLMVDDSVKNKLERLERQMISGQKATIKEVA